MESTGHFHGETWLSGDRKDCSRAQCREAEHAAEPAPVVTDELMETAVEAASAAWNDGPRAAIRAALEAAAPLLGPRPLLHQGDVFAALEDVYTSGAMGGEWPHLGTDAVMELARPMPTREQIDPFLQEWRVRPPGQPTQQEAVNYRRKMRNALLALLNDPA